MAEPDPCIKLDIGSHFCWSCAGWCWIYCKRLEVIIVIHVLCLYMYVSVYVCVCLYVHVCVFLGLFIISSHASNTLSSVICMYVYVLQISSYTVARAFYILYLYIYICMQCYLCTYMKHDCGILLFSGMHKCINHDALNCWSTIILNNFCTLALQF